MRSEKFHSVSSKSTFRPLQDLIQIDAQLQRRCSDRCAPPATDARRVHRDLLPHIRWLRRGGGEPDDGRSGDATGHRHHLGLHRDGDDLLGRTRLRRALQPRRDHRLC
jgi:hypothetical protein